MGRLEAVDIDAGGHARLPDDGLAALLNGLVENRINLPARQVVEVELDRTRGRQGRGDGWSPLLEQRFDTAQRRGRDCGFPFFEILYPVIKHIGNVDVFITGPEGKVSGIIKFTRPRTRLTPFSQERTRRCEILDAVIVRIGNEDDAVERRDGNAFRVVELTVFLTPGAPLSQETAVAREVLNAASDVLQYINVTVGRFSDVRRFSELAVAGPVRAPFT